MPASNIAYSAWPTDLRALCVAQIEIKAAQRQLLALVFFSPSSGTSVFPGGGKWRVFRRHQPADIGAAVGYGFMSMSPDTDHHSTAVDVA